jgi:hypothetical protein
MNALGDVAIGPANPVTSSAGTDAFAKLTFSEQEG